MKRFKLNSELFVVSTALAALSHSTWTLSTLFSGMEPQPQFTPAWFAWVIPGFLIAVSFDVGMISVSDEIRNGNRSRAKYLALGVLSASMFLLQWGYISHHMPALALAPGVRAEWQGIAALLRDSLLWIIPALLPMAVTLHTFSNGKPAEPKQPETALSSTALVALHMDDVEHILIEKTAESPAETVDIECPDCDWGGTYSSTIAARNALIAHRRKHPTTVSPNGHK